MIRRSRQAGYYPPNLESAVGQGWIHSRPGDQTPSRQVSRANSKGRASGPRDRGSVDYALLDRGDPLVFVEAKRIGSAGADGVEQLFGYAAHQGVPFLVLTDGIGWDFYLSMAAGMPEERRFYRLELLPEPKIPEDVHFLNEHLQRDRVVSGRAKSSAEQRHAGNRERTKAREAISGVWKNLLREPDKTLRDLLADAVKSDCGTKPERDDVESFLKGLLSSPTPLQPDPRPSPPDPKPSRPRPQPERPPERSRINGFILRGERMEIGAANKTLGEILMRFDLDDPEFMQRFSLRTIGRGRRLVARNRSDLYDKRHLERYATQLTNGWWLGTNISQAQVRQYVEIACSVME